MKVSTPSLALGVALAFPVAAYADEIPNMFEELFRGSDYSHRAHHPETNNSAQVDPFKPRTSDG
jgi:hypothetical protein